jgi:hypothetical protein
MNKINDQIYIGNIFDAKKEKELKDNGIELALNLIKQLNGPEINGIKTTKVGLIDGESEINTKGVPLAINTLIKMIKSGKKILVYCFAGKHRSAFIIAKTLAKLNGTDRHDEFSLIKEKRPVVEIKPWMEKF